jgi:16S rRNA (guanine527-N7)-methyltransferase
MLANELERALPRDLPRRAELLDGARRHAELVLAANERLNLTRITSPRDVALKHVADCLLPWRRFLELLPAPSGSSASPPASPSPEVVDLGSGAGYPGILLALLLPHARVHVVESVQKKAAFLAEAVRALELRNVEVHAERAESLLESRETPVALVVARAVGAAREILRLLKRARGRFGRLALYKGPSGPELEQEIAQAANDAEKLALVATVTFRGELPDDAGARSLLEYGPA